MKTIKNLLLSILFGLIIVASSEVEAMRARLCKVSSPTQGDELSDDELSEGNGKKRKKGRDGKERRMRQRRPSLPTTGLAADEVIDLTGDDEAEEQTTEGPLLSSSGWTSLSLGGSQVDEDEESKSSSSSSRTSLSSGSRLKQQDDESVPEEEKNDYDEERKPSFASLQGTAIKIKTQLLLGIFIIDITGIDQEMSLFTDGIPTLGSLVDYRLRTLFHSLHAIDAFFSHHTLWDDECRALTNKRYEAFYKVIESEFVKVLYSLFIQLNDLSSLLICDCTDTPCQRHNHVSEYQSRQIEIIRNLYEADSDEFTDLLICAEAIELLLALNEKMLLLFLDSGILFPYPVDKRFGLNFLSYLNRFKEKYHRIDKDFLVQAVQWFLRIKPKRYHCVGNHPTADGPSSFTTSYYYLMPGARRIQGPVEAPEDRFDEEKENPTVDPRLDDVIVKKIEKKAAIEKAAPTIKADDMYATLAQNVRLYHCGSAPLW